MYKNLFSLVHEYSINMFFCYYKSDKVLDFYGFVPQAT